MADSINSIWQRILNDDAGAWRELVHRFEALVNTVARRCGLDSGDAADCAQHVWMSLYRNRRAIRDPRRLPKWLIMTARRRSIRIARQNRQRSASRSAHRPGEDMPPLPDEEVERLERQAELEMALLQLDGRCQALLRALFLAPREKSYREIASELGLPVNSIGPIRTRCLNRLRRVLDDLQIGSD